MEGGSTKRVAVIGAGIAGLTSVKACLEEKLDVVCFEQFGYIGGGWFCTDTYQEGQGAAVWRSVYGNGGTLTAGFSDFPFPEDAPVVYSNKMFLNYLNNYADHFKLKPHIRLNTKIHKIDKAPDYSTSGYWEVTYTTEGASQQTETFDYVMVATGYHRLPTYPEIEGMETFKGEVSHSLHYRSSDNFKGKTVVIAGNSFSASDIAGDISKVVKKVYVCVGRGTCVIPVTLASGITADQIFFVRSDNYLSPWLHSMYVRWRVYWYAPNKINMKNFGIPAHSKNVFPPMFMNDSLPDLIMKQEVFVKGKIARITPGGVVLSSGEKIKDVDHIIYATAFKPSFSFIDKSIIPEERSDMKLYRQVWPISLEHPTLAMIGCCGYVPGAVNMVFEMQARWAVATFTGHCSLPARDVMERAIEVHKQGDLGLSPRVRWIIPFTRYMDDVAADIGARPKLIRSLLFDGQLGNRLLLGPFVPVQFRIWGRHSIPVAREMYLKECADSYDKAIKVTDVSTILRLGVLGLVLGLGGGVYMGWIALKQ